jgi:transcriptional regulator with XRE-family HTH domain
VTLAARLKQLRGKEKKSLQEIADAVGSSKAHIWDLETGKSKNPTMELLTKMAKHFKVSVSFLVGEDKGSEDENFQVMYRDYEGLSDRDKNAIKKLIDALQPNSKISDEN